MAFVPIKAPNVNNVTTTPMEPIQLNHLELLGAPMYPKVGCFCRFGVYVGTIAFCVIISSQKYAFYLRDM